MDEQDDADVMECHTPEEADCWWCGRDHLPEHYGRFCSDACEAAWIESTTARPFRDGWFCTTWAGTDAPDWFWVADTSVRVAAGVPTGGQVRYRKATYRGHPDTSSELEVGQEWPSVLALLHAAAVDGVNNLPVLADAVEETGLPGAAACAAVLRTPGLDGVPF